MRTLKLLLGTALAATMACANAQGYITPGNTLPSGSYLYPGAVMTSPNGTVRLSMQYDGNLVLYNPAMQPIWSSGTSGRPGSYMVLQYDGNLVVRDGNGNALYNIFDFSRSPHAIYTSGVGGPSSFLSVEDSGNMIVFAGRTDWIQGASIVPGANAATVVRAGQTIQSGQSVVSPSGRFSLVMQTDGNLVLKDGGTPYWSSGTAGYYGARATLQTDGNFVIYYGSTPVWYTSTNLTTTDGKYTTLIVANDGHIQIVNYFRNFTLSGAAAPAGGAWTPNSTWGLACVVNADLTWYCWPTL